MVIHDAPAPYRGPRGWFLYRLRERLGHPGFGIVLTVWGSLVGVCIASGLINVWLGWNGIPVVVDGVTIDLTIYPPFVVCLLLTVWLGPGWGMVPLYLANLGSALFAGLSPGVAAVFALAAPVELILIWGSMVLLNVDPSLRRLKDAGLFVAIGLIAATASSLATPIWNAANELDLMEGLRVWRGWVIGDLAQAVLVGAPMLRLFTDRVRDALVPRFPDSPGYPENHAAAVSFVSSIFALLGALAFQSVRALVGTLALDPATRTPGGEPLLPRLQEIGVLMVVVFVVLMLTAVVYTWALAHSSARDRQVARRDPLTGCPNRRAFSEIFERESARSRRLRQGLSVLFLDIDHFKGVNDRLGHVVGDRVLQLVARRLDALVRDTDYVFRWGGEEFLVLLPHTRPSEASTMAERIRAAVARHGFIAQDGREAVHITVSIGVAGTSEPPERAEGLIALADTLVYQAKNAGRNRVESLGEA